MGDFAKDYADGVDAQPTAFFDTPATFQGIRRPDGRIATRNYIGILTSVTCSAHVAGVVALTHKTGCGVNQIGGLMEEQRLAGRLRGLDIQTMGGSRKTVAAGIDFVKEVLAEANAVKRETVPASALTVALQCGGSDGYSVVSANPALGVASDLLVRHGGSVILSETPETYGAEHLLTRRAVTPAVGKKLVGLMRWWEEYTEREGAEMNANPSPGNKAGGLTTILEKSLGAMAKAGSTNLVCFTTGRGSVFGCKPAPSIKLATNTPMFKHIEDDMDVNRGTVLDGDESVQECGARIFDLILRVASGEQTRSESFDFGSAEFAPWVLGATM